MPTSPSERAHVAAYRYDEEGIDIEVVPLGNDRAVLAELLEVDPAAHVELYRVWSGTAPVAWGVRSFDAGGATLARREMSADQWSDTRDRLLSFERPAQ